MFRQCKRFTRFIRRYRAYMPNNFYNFRKLINVGPVQLLIGSQVFYDKKMGDDCDPQEKLEDDIIRAIQEGKAATINLMTQLKEQVVVKSGEYRKCIKKQIEIMKKATFLQAGPYSEAYDELPEYRTLANELKKELTTYYTLFNTLVNLAHNENTCAKDPEKGKKVSEFKELLEVVEQEIELNSKFEKELLQAFTDNILNEVLFDPSV